MKNLTLFLLLLLPALSFAQGKTQETEASFDYFEVNPITSSNFSPEFIDHYNKGIRAYNQAVAIIDKAAATDDPTAAGTLEQEAVKYFKHALPLLEKAYSLNDKHKDLVTALAGTYIGLDNFTKHKEMMKKLEKFESSK